MNLKGIFSRNRLGKLKKSIVRLLYCFTLGEFPNEYVSTTSGNGIMAPSNYLENYKGKDTI
jgi:hypothetical protein